MEALRTFEASAPARKSTASDLTAASCSLFAPETSSVEAAERAVGNTTDATADLTTPTIVYTGERVKSAEKADTVESNSAAAINFFMRFSGVRVCVETKLTHAKKFKRRHVKNIDG